MVPCMKTDGKGVLTDVCCCGCGCCFVKLSKHAIELTVCTTEDRTFWPTSKKKTRSDESNQSPHILFRSVLSQNFLSCFRLSVSYKEGQSKIELFWFLFGSCWVFTELFVVAVVGDAAARLDACAAGTPLHMTKPWPLWWGARSRRRCRLSSLIHL